jgi:hypothetical protein
VGITGWLGSKSDIFPILLTANLALAAEAMAGLIIVRKKSEQIDRIIKNILLIDLIFKISLLLTVRCRQAQMDKFLYAEFET